MSDQAYIDGLVEKARLAMGAISNYDQAQIDEIVRAIGKVAYDNAEAIAKFAVEETGMGDYESKVSKNKNAPTAAWNFLKGKKSMGIIDEDPVKCVVTIAAPAGVVACITPTTGATSTVIVNAMHAIKGKNAVIIGPHPKAKKCGKFTVDLMNNEIKKLGGPDNLIQIIEEPSIELTQLLMKSANIVLATGGADMVKSAYSSGRPALGVGQGNVQVVVDEDYTDYQLIAANITKNRSYDNGLPCTGEQAIFVAKNQKDAIIKAFEANNAYFFEDPVIIQKFRERLFTNGNINRDFVGKYAHEVAKMVGEDVPESTKILLLKGDKIGRADLLCKELMCPVVKLFVCDSFEEAVASARANLLMEGAGHSAVVYTENPEKMVYAGLNLPVCRMNVNQPGIAGGGSPYNNGVDPTMSLGCGIWGNNSISENTTYKHLLNHTRVIKVIPGAHIPTPEEIWGC